MIRMQMFLYSAEAGVFNVWVTDDSLTKLAL